MKLTKQQIQEFQELYKQEHGVSLTFEQAEQRAYQVMNLYYCLRNHLAEKSISPNPSDHE